MMFNPNVEIRYHTKYKKVTLRPSSHFSKFHFLLSSHIQREIEITLTSTLAQTLTKYTHGSVDHFRDNRVYASRFIKIDPACNVFSDPVSQSIWHNETPPHAIEIKITKNLGNTPDCKYILGFAPLPKV